MLAVQATDSSSVFSGYLPIMCGRGESLKRSVDVNGASPLVRRVGASHAAGTGFTGTQLRRAVRSVAGPTREAGLHNRGPESGLTRRGRACFYTTRVNLGVDAKVYNVKQRRQHDDGLVAATPLPARARVDDRYATHINHILRSAVGSASGAD